MKALKIRRILENLKESEIDIDTAIEQITKEETCYGRPKRGKKA